MSCDPKPYLDGRMFREEGMGHYLWALTYMQAIRGSVNHFFVHCRFSTRLLRLVKDWIGIPEMYTNN
jgi:hypothetical protein